jgi:glutamate-ammonia-ligase adenylyltransferase
MPQYDRSRDGTTPAGVSRTVATPESLGLALAAAPDPELARVTVARLQERRPARALLERPEVLQAVAPLLGFSTAAADFFLTHPDELASFADLRPRSVDELRAEASGDVAAAGPIAGLRRFRRRASYRVAARDLDGAPVEDVMAELSAAADVCLEVAAASASDSDGDSARLAVVALGKLGGAELNYASDVDVVFVHAEPGADAQARASRAAAALIALLSEPTEGGVALRVDANLRPDGRGGALSRSLEAMLTYYERHAATWERQAMLRARPVAGDAEVGARFADGVTPFVFPAVLPASAVEDVRASKVRIEEHVRALGKQDVELKRGRGGIRDVEFAVQLLQLVHGRRDERLRHTNTLAALAALAEGGYVRTADAEALAGSYRFLRRLEHRLQMVRDQQTHELPSDPHALSTLGRAMGLSDGVRLRAEFERHTVAVRGLHERLFYRPLMEALATASGPTPGADRASTEELLAGLGFADATTAYELLVRVMDPARQLGRVLGTLSPVIVPALAEAAVPDAALVRFARVADAARDGGLEAELADRLVDRPDAARRVAALAGASSAFADALIARPQTIRLLYEVPPEAPSLFAGDEPRDALIRVAAAHAARELRVPETGRRIADAADAAVGRALAAADPRDPVAVIGMGRLGGADLSFASDLDVLFVYDGDGPEAFQRSRDAAERTVARLRDEGWAVDADLRPEGRSGPLARSMASYIEYWQRWAQTWEYQSLLRARLVAGDEFLGRRFVSNAADFAYPEALTVEDVAAIRRMRVRMEEERVRPRGAGRFNFKLGHGGLADVQFAVELSLMRHGARHPEVRHTHTLEALEALARARLIEDSVSLSLSQAYTFLTEVKLGLEIEQRVAAQALPAAPESQAALARRLGYGEMARSRFLEDYLRITRRARQAMERVFYPEEGAA